MVPNDDRSQQIRLIEEFAKSDIRRILLPPTGHQDTDKHPRKNPANPRCIPPFLRSPSHTDNPYTLQELRENPYLAPDSSIAQIDGETAYI